MNCALIGLTLLLPLAGASPQTARNFDRFKIGDGIYAFIQRDPFRSPIDGNSTVIIGDADVIVVDSRSTPASAWALIEEIRALTPKPVRYVINTHWHPDHHYGNDAFRTAYPGVEILAHAATRADMLAQLTDSSRLAQVARLPNAIAQVKTMLATGKTPDGAPMPDELRAFLGHRVTECSDDIRLHELLHGPPVVGIQEGARDSIRRIRELADRSQGTVRSSAIGRISTR